MIEAESNPDGSVYGCRIHNMVLDFIRLVSDKENFLTVSHRMDDGRGTLIKPSTVRNPSTIGPLGTLVRLTTWTCPK